MHAKSPHTPRWLVAVGKRLAWFAAVLLVGGLLGGALVRVAPGFGTDERALDARLSNSSIAALREAPAEGSDLAVYYWRYLGGLLRGDLGSSVSLGRPVKELLGERLVVRVRSASTGLSLASTVALCAV